MAMAVQARLEAADSIISRMHRAAERYADFIHEYHADLYVKAQLDIIRKNAGFRYIPGLFRTDRNTNRYIVETYSELHYTAPNIYDRKIKSYTGTLRDARYMPGITDYFSINIYAPYMLGEKLLSPLAPNSHRYYRYAIDSVSCDSMRRLEYHIRFIPRNKSLQLVEGEMTVTEGAWSVRHICFKGKSELLQFACRIRMGEIGSDTEYLPVENETDASFAFAFNVMDGYYKAYISYNDIRHRDNTPPDSLTRKNYNLSASFSLQCDRQAYTRDFQRFDTLRPEPLSPLEQNIYVRHTRQKDSVQHNKYESPQWQRRRLWLSVGDFLLTDNKWKLTDNAMLRSSPFINPLFLTYSKSNGLSYKQDFKLNTVLRNQQSLHSRIRLGYNFTHKEFYWSASGEYQYLPERLGRLSVHVGNGNRIGSSAIIDELKKFPSDSLIDFNKLNLDLFLDLNVEVNNRIEITNGLLLDLGLVFHRRTPAKHPDDSFRSINLPADIAEGLQVNVRPEYNSFAPRIRLEWTPKRYYYMNGRQKTYLRSRFPTFIIDYERGLKGVFRSTGVYERIEFDMQHQVRTGLLSRLYYRMGFGMFTNQKETYFVDFVNFRKNNLPGGWNDDIGGVFQALNGRWYNASPYYVRGHVTYEAPFLLLRHLMKYTNHVQHERLYLNLLTMDRLGPYFELGYGIGTFVFDMGIFLSLEKFNNVGFGYKFTFELFNN